MTKLKSKSLTSGTLRNWAAQATIKGATGQAAALREAANLCDSLGDQATRDNLRAGLNGHQGDPAYADRWYAFEWLCYWMDH